MGLSDDDRVAVGSIMGASLVLQERLIDAALAVEPERMMERFTGRKFDAIMTVEIGGSNGLQPWRELFSICRWWMRMRWDALFRKRK